MHLRNGATRPEHGLLPSHAHMVQRPGRRVSTFVSEEVFEAIERARGDMPRERWLRLAVEAALGRQESERHQPRLA